MSHVISLPPVRLHMHATQLTSIVVGQTRLYPVMVRTCILTRNGGQSSYKLNPYH